MPQRAWNRKQERQSEHINAGQKRQGRSEEVAARTVNKQRVRAGDVVAPRPRTSRHTAAQASAPVRAAVAGPSSSWKRTPSALGPPGAPP
jgi:hypothetical protein